MKKENKIFWIFIMIILIIAGLYYLFFYEKPIEQEEYHIHADFAVYLNGSFHNFNQDRYMSTSEVYQNKYVHLHDGVGDVVHFHDQFVTFREFFSSLNMTFNETCFVLDNENYCSNDNNVLEMYVNSKKVEITKGFAPRDLDRILIYYGEPLEDISFLTNQVSDKACIQSGLCPERGEPSDESSCGPDSCVVSIN